MKSIPEIAFDAFVDEMYELVVETKINPTKRDLQAICRVIRAVLDAPIDGDGRQITLRKIIHQRFSGMEANKIIAALTGESHE